METPAERRATIVKSKFSCYSNQLNFGREEFFHAADNRFYKDIFDDIFNRFPTDYLVYGFPEFADCYAFNLINRLI